MSTPAYLNLLTPEERVASLKMGMSMKCAESGVKQADLISLSPDGVMKAVLVTSLLGGVPIGVAAHVIGRRVTATSNKERELKERIKYYRGATRGLATQMQPQPAAKVDTQDTSAT